MIPQTLRQYQGIVGATPTIPKFYWDVKSQEQRIKIMCYLIQGLIDNYASTDSQISKNTKDIAELTARFDAFVEHGFDEYYEQQVIEWISQHIGVLYEQLAHQVFFGLTSDGHFCAYVPESWSEITFDTGAVYGTDWYGRLILRYDADGSGVIDNTQYDSSVLTDTIDGRIKAAAGDGIEYVDGALTVPLADAITYGRVKLTHDITNDTTTATATSPEAVYKFSEHSK